MVHHLTWRPLAITSSGTMHRVARIHSLVQIESAFSSHAGFPERASRGKELLWIRILGFREIFVKPDRTTYRATADIVYAPLVADGRRDVQVLL